MESSPGCIFVTTLLHYLFLAVFSLSLCEGMMVFTLFTKPFYNGFFHQMSFYMAVGWGLPIPIVVISVAASHDNYGLYYNEERWACWISEDNGAIWAFTAPMIIIVLVNYFFLIISVFKVYQLKMYKQKVTAEQQSKYKTARAILISILALLPLLGGTWILGLLLLFDSDSEPLAWIFTILNSLQGFAIFFFHVLRNKEVINVYINDSKSPEVA
ncbi:adhesion G-protein coupled receptor D1-like [Dysidea avara]|uniref:adhesion G-protein coupled receptor D1-like n=1 Tax=Dysidea avara TaxID=196820 RepID=UPI00331BD2B6